MPTRTHAAPLRSSSLALLMAAALLAGCGDSGPGGRKDAGDASRADGNGDGTHPDGTGVGGTGGSGTGGHGGTAADGGAGAGGGGNGDGAAGAGGAGGADGGGSGGAGGMPMTCTTGQGCTLPGSVSAICGNNVCAACTTDSACQTAYGAGHLCVLGNCVTGNCHQHADCNGQLCDAASNSCIACTSDSAGDGACVTAFGANHVCQNGKCVDGNCRGNNDCSNGQICSSGSQTCVACSGDPSCVSAYGAGHLCISGGCVSGTCRAGGDCSNGQICVVGSHTCAPCGDDNSCQTSYGAGHLCENSKCINGNCRAAADCSNGQLCTANSCTACTADGQCPAGQLCLSGGCTSGNCRVAADCGNGQICTGNNCQVCATDPDCVSGYGANHLCQAGACVTGNCRVTADCAAGGLVCDSGTRTCSACSGDPDCVTGYGAGHLCVGGVCITGTCRVASDCGNGKVCDLATHACTACASDASCVSGYGAQHLCENGACISGQCRVAQDCSGGQLCNTGNFTCGACTTDTQCVSGYGANHLCVGGACVSGQCHVTADCGGGQLCNTGNLTCVACSTDNQCVTDYGPQHLCVSGQCIPGQCRTSPDCPVGQLCNAAAHTCGTCASDAACKGDTAYGSTTICLGNACTTGDCHDTSTDCTAGQICGLSTAHTCGTCSGDSSCTSDSRYGAGNICFQGNCQLGNCHANSADCISTNAGLICGASAPNNCGACASDGQCKADTFYGSSTICTTANGASKGKCVTAACPSNGTACAANAADFCCGNLCVPGNCCNDTDCVNNGSFGVGFACVGNSCSQCAPVSGNKYYVDPVNGNDQTATGSGLTGATATPSCRFKTITRAIAVIGNFAAANTKVIIVGAAGSTTGLNAGDALPITLPPNVIISTQGGPITVTLPAAANQANPTNNSGFVLSSNGSGIAGDPAAPLTLDGNGNTSGIAVAVSGAAVTASLSNLTIQNTRGHGISVSSGTLNVGAGVVVKNAGTAAIARDGIIVAGTIAAGAVTAAGVANISVPAGQTQTLFTGNSSHGIEVTTGGSVNVTGAPGAPLPSINGTVVSSLNTTAGLRINQTPGTTGLGTSNINGLVTWGNGNYGARLFAGSKIKARSSIFGANGTDGILLSNGAGAPGLDVSTVDLGTAGDFGHNYLQVPLGSNGNNPTAGLCVNLGAATATGSLQAAGNFMVTGAGVGSAVDCSATAATITSGTCANRNSLGINATTIVTVVLDLCM